MDGIECIEGESGAGSLATAVPARRPCVRSVYAALDLGTNNCRLLIARPEDQGGFRVIDAFSRIVRLGEGVMRTQRLSEAAMERALSALRVCGFKLRRRGVTVWRAVATEACRRADNRDDFLRRVERETGIRIEIISTGEEARLALAGCAPLLDPDIPRALVFDIGGGSTELMWLEVDPITAQPRLLDQISLSQGVVGLAERYGGDCVDAAVYDAMMADIAARIAPFEARNGIRQAALQGKVQILGTSGTVTTLAGIHLGLRRYERALVDGTVLDIADARAIIDRLLGLDYARRAVEPCIGPERADLVMAGCAIFDALIRAWPVERLRIADRGLREGILLDLIDSGRA